MKWPPHTFTTTPMLAWRMDAGGDVIAIAGTRLLACRRCKALSEPLADHGAIGAFLRAHDGPTCNTGEAKRPRSRRAA